jgi:hypothetical protein
MLKAAIYLLYGVLINSVGLMEKNGVFCKMDFGRPFIRLSFANVDNFSLGSLREELTGVIKQKNHVTACSLLILQSFRIFVIDSNFNPINQNFYGL